MLAAYIADPRIGAIADFYMPETKDRQWQKERMEAFVRADTLRENLEARFFYLEVFNDCRLELDEEAYANDISLKSEMIRMVLGDDSLSESEKSRIIQCGWNALRGKELPE